MRRRSTSSPSSDRPPGRRRAARAAAALCAALIGAWPRAPLRAQECGPGAPDYTAVRVVEVGGHSVRLRVDASGGRLREEAELGGGKRRVTIRDPDRERVVTFDPAEARGVVLPLPRRPTDGAAADRRRRTLDEAGPDGTRVRRVEFERGGAWIELSRSVCRPDGVLLRQSFVAVGPDGREVKGSVAQEDIRVGRIPPGRFEVPREVQLQRP